MTAASLDFTYRYAYASGLEQTDQGSALCLATCGADQQQPNFFDGKMLAPRETGEMLLVLSDVVRTHFFLRRPALLDPVVTSSEHTLRIEGFSGCCGVYVRADLPTEAFDCSHLGSGTTNVDFNNPMRAALARLRNEDDVRFAVGGDGVELSKGEESIIEKKVKLPIRWIKGFSEVQLYQPSMQLKIETTGSEARRFVRSLPKSGAPKKPSFVVQSGKSIRLSQRPGKGAVQFHGTHRIRVLEPLLNTAKQFRIWSDDESGTTAWEVKLKAGRFYLMLSPEVYRGFSGEGQALEKLRAGSWDVSLPKIQKLLDWQSRLSLETLTEQTGCTTEEVESALVILGSRGLAGYDLGREAYFHRQLPFELDKVEQLQPRLTAARKLIEKGGIVILGSQSNDSSKQEIEVEVPGTDVTHLVRLSESGDKCTCPWHSKYQGKRGPCKHILAARIITVESNEREPETDDGS